MKREGISRSFGEIKGAERRCGGSAKGPRSGKRGGLGSPKLGREFCAGNSPGGGKGSNSKGGIGEPDIHYLAEFRAKGKGVKNRFIRRERVEHLETGKKRDTVGTSCIGGRKHSETKKMGYWGHMLRNPGNLWSIHPHIPIGKRKIKENGSVLATSCA